MSIALKSLDQQVLVVFGASRGIGRATALLAAQRGAKVVAAARDREALQSLVTEALPAKVVIAEADVVELAQVREVAELAASHFGRIDTWAHVAGVGAYARFEDITPEEFRQVIDVDLMGPVYGAMAAMPYLRQQGGALVVVSSEVARRAFPLVTAYSAAKHGVDGFLEALRVEFQHDRIPISVTQIMPAAIATPFFEQARTRLGVRPSGPPPVILQRRLRRRSCVRRSIPSAICSWARPRGCRCCFRSSHPGCWMRSAASRDTAFSDRRHLKHHRTTTRCSPHRAVTTACMATSTTPIPEADD